MQSSNLSCGKFSFTFFAYDEALYYQCVSVRACLYGHIAFLFSPTETGLIKGGFISELGT